MSLPSRAVTPAETGRRPSTMDSAARPFALVVSRAMGTVVVTVRGDLDPPASRLFGRVLGDLIDDQGNLAVQVDLRRLRRVSPPGLEVLRSAARSLDRRGGRLRLNEPRAAVRDALTLGGLVDLVTVRGQTFEWAGPAGGLPRRAGLATLHPAGSNLSRPTTKETDDPL